MRHELWRDYSRTTCPLEGVALPCRLHRVIQPQGPKKNKTRNSFFVSYNTFMSMWVPVSGGKLRRVSLRLPSAAQEHHQASVQTLNNNQRRELNITHNAQTSVPCCIKAVQTITIKFLKKKSPRNIKEKQSPHRICNDNDESANQL